MIHLTHYKLCLAEIFKDIEGASYNGFQRLPIMLNNQVAPIRILLAEDDLDDRHFFAKALKEINISTYCHTVNDGIELMNYLNKDIVNIPDILFLDLNMPRKNGFECLLEIKESIQMQAIYVIMFSILYPRDANYEQDLLERLKKIGAQDFIRKSGDFELSKQLLELAIYKVINNSKYDNNSTQNQQFSSIENFTS